MSYFEYVPGDFGKSTTYCIPKGDRGKCSNSSENYRGTSISPLLAKIYEHCQNLLQIYANGQ